MLNKEDNMTTKKCKKLNRVNIGKQLMCRGCSLAKEYYYVYLRTKDIYVFISLAHYTKMAIPVTERLQVPTLKSQS